MLVVTLLATAALFEMTSYSEGKVIDVFLSFFVSKRWRYVGFGAAK